MKTSYLLSDKFPFADHAPFAFATMLVLSGGEGYFRPGDVMRHMTSLIHEGASFDTQQQTEIGRWDRRFDIELTPVPDIPSEHYFAYVDPNYWDYDPPLVTYTKAEFMTLFEDCCRNFVAHSPERREEFAAALVANGMSLKVTLERP